MASGYYLWVTYLGLFYSHREKFGQCHPHFQHVCPCWSTHTMERQNTEAPTSALLLEGRDCPLKAGISLCMSKAPSAVTPQHFSRSVTDPLSAILAPRTKLGWFFCCFVSNKDQISRAILEKVWHSPAKKKMMCCRKASVCTECVLAACTHAPASATSWC